MRLAERGEGGAQTCLKREVLLVSLLPPLRLKAVDRCVYSVELFSQRAFRGRLFVPPHRDEFERSGTLFFILFKS